MEQHPVPQDITGFQFKLIGDMTVKQFVYLGGGLLIAFIISRLGVANFVKYPLLAVFGVGGAALAFLDIDKRPLDRIVLSFFKSVYRETRFVWKKSPTIPDVLLESPNVYYQTPPVQTSSGQGKMKLEEFLKTLPQKTKNDIDKNEEQKLGLILNTFNNTVVKKITNQIIHTPTPSYTPPHQIPVFPIASGYKTETVLYPGQKAHFNPSVDIKVRKLGATTINPIPPTPTHIQQTPTNQPPQIQPRPPLEAKNYVIADQAGKLERSTPLKKTVFVAPAGPQNQASPIKTPTNPEEKRLYELSQQNQNLENQRKSLESKLEKLKTEPLSPNTTAADFDKTIKALARDLQETERQRQAAVEELFKLKRKLEQKKVVSPSLDQKEEKPSARFVSPITAKRVGLPVINYAPNIINGIVLEPNGNVLSSVVLVVKDQNENPVRAFKSNKLGQFSIATPLANGTYIIDIEKEGFDFDIIKLDLKGEPLPPIEIKARTAPKPDLS